MKTPSGVWDYPGSCHHRLMDTGTNTTRVHGTGAESDISSCV